ncbi:hypothetical protein AVEN_45316-1 [Araneus ventricosus]|uniref:Uncharacterized protein n=1 Tax=Araneus ventricosus TaxID=182803 RepID=A0A4Y2WBE6_ARAVE|nr:hypothetical protein AVEN_45316-1 [Araneus ventricosus]
MAIQRDTCPHSYTRTTKSISFMGYDWDNSRFLDPARPSIFLRHFASKIWTHQHRAPMTCTPIDTCVCPIKSFILVTWREGYTHCWTLCIQSSLEKIWSCCSDFVQLCI